MFPLCQFLKTVFVHQIVNNNNLLLININKICKKLIDLEQKRNKTVHLALKNLDVKQIIRNFANDD